MQNQKQAIASMAGFLALLALTCLALISVDFAAKAAETYPSRAITLIVPFPPGGGNDLLARLIGENQPG